jgi:putative DNA methylase
MTAIKSPKKLIEVALPLDAINAAAAREKSIRHGHPSTLHLWWARRPLAAARAVLFAQMVNDPGYQQGGGFRYGVNKEKAALERERLFRIIEELVQWENTSNEELLERARAEIRHSWRETCELNKSHPQATELFDPEVLPAFHDPFAGGGAIPLEAQRLGLDSHASDLNPVAVTINKAQIEIPQRFARRVPVGPKLQRDKQRRLHDEWGGYEGIAEDVRRYGAWMKAQAVGRLSDMYPPVKIDAALVAKRADLKPLLGKDVRVIAWIWARTVRSPNPAFSHVSVPLVSSFVLSSNEERSVFVKPVVSGDSFEFDIELGIPPVGSERGTKTGGARGAFQCLMSGSPIDFKYIRSEAKKGKLGQRLMAIVIETPMGRMYLPPLENQERAALAAEPSWVPDTSLPERALSMRVQEYGMTRWADLFTARQLMLLSTLSDLVKPAIDQCAHDAQSAWRAELGIPLRDGGDGALAYAEAVGTFLALAVDKLTDYNATLVSWSSSRDQAAHVFTKQALPMVWDFAEVNPFAEAAGDIEVTCDGIARSIRNLPLRLPGIALQADAQSQQISNRKVVSTDPPYYDNIGYADLSDFFYVWLRRSLRSVFPDLFATVGTPKQQELVATPFRHGSKDAAESFFLSGMKDAIASIATKAHPAIPVTIYYAFKQSETRDDGQTSSTGWETFLQAVVDAGLVISGTWPIRTERAVRSVSQGTNALASSVVLVCRKRPADAVSVTRREFIRELNAVLPEALDEMTRGGVNSPVAPVDLSQAIIGPGMAIFSQYASVLEADGTPMPVKTALQLINRFLAEDDFDHDTQFCLHWFEQQGWATGRFGEADVLARAKGTSVSGLQATGVVQSGKGDLRLLRWAELPRDWSPETDTRLPVWEALHHLICALNQDGESVAGALLARMPAKAEPIRALAYRLYTLCERKGWTEDARAYNELVTAWSAIEQAAGEAGVVGSQAQLDI